MVSIIVPVYNIETYVDSCIASLVSQTYTDLEIILVDDGSTDNSGNICRNWRSKDPRISFFTRRNQGVSAARNFGISRSAGDFLMFVDGDDRITPCCIERMMSAMSPDTDIVCCGCALEKEDPAMEESFVYGNRQGQVTPREYFCDLFDCVLYTQTVWGKIFRRKLWDNISFETMRNGEDSLAMLKIFRMSPRLYMLNEAHYLYFQRASGASRIRDREYYICDVYIRNQAFQTALARYPEYRSKAGSLYIAMAYCLLKIYAAEANKKDGIALIREMKTIYAGADIQHPTRAQQFLRLPPAVIFCLIRVKRMIKG